MKYLILIPLAVILIALPMNFHLEKKSYNKGFCPECSHRLKLFDIDSQGGRGYWCNNCNYHTWVSYYSIDKR